MGTKKQKQQAVAFALGMLMVVFAPDIFNQTFGKLLKKEIQVGE